jgi:hypothetical protein
MALHGWVWADLNADQMNLIHQAEETLGADYILAFQPDDPPGHASAEEAEPPFGLQAAELNPSQLECLAGLEHMLGAVIVAYAVTPAA